MAKTPSLRSSPSSLTPAYATAQLVVPKSIPKVFIWAGPSPLTRRPLPPLGRVFRLDQAAWSRYPKGVKRQVNIYEAKTHLSQLLKDALQGTDVIIARDGVPLVRLVPVTPERPASLLGLEQGISLSKDFDEPLDDFAGY